MISVSCYPVSEVPLRNLFLSALCYPYQRPCHGGSASVLFCYPDLEVPLWNWLFVTSRVYVLFCSVLFMLMDVSRKLNHDLWFLSVYDLDKLWFWYELNYDFWICTNSFIETLYSIIIHWASLTVYIMYVGEPACDQGQSWWPSVLFLSANCCASRGGSKRSLMPWLFLYSC